MREGDIVYLGSPPMRVDLLTAIDGVDADALFARAVRAEIDGLEIYVISLDDLIANKRAVGRPRDLDDAAFLERVRDRAR
jgi:predicted nucleotidyltransferase